MGRRKGSWTLDGSVTECSEEAGQMAGRVVKGEREEHRSWPTGLHYRRSPSRIPEPTLLKWGECHLGTVGLG